MTRFWKARRGGLSMPALLLLALGCLSAGCAHGRTAAEEIAEVPVEPTVVLDEEEARALAARELIADADAHWQLESWARAELDGTPPAELVVRVIVAAGEGAFEQLTAAYSVAADGSTRRLAPPLETGGYRDPGYLEVVDLDRDGRDELLVVGDTSADSPSALSVFTLLADAERGWRFDDINHEEAPGVSYLPWDVTGDGQLEIVAFDRDWSSAEQPPLVRVLALRDGRYRHLVEAPSVESYLGGLTEQLVLEREVERPWILLALILDLLRLHGVMPPQAAELTEVIRERRLGEDASTVVEPWLRLLAYLAPDELLASVPDSIADENELFDHLGPAVRDIAAHGSPRQLAGLLALLEAALAAERGINVVGGVLVGLGARDDVRAAARVRAAIADEDASPQWRADLLSRFGARDPACAEIVLSILERGEDPTLTRAAALALASSSSSAQPSAEAWRATLPLERLRLLLGHPDEQVRHRLLSHLVDREEPEVGEVFLELLESSSDSEERRIALRGLRRRNECSHRALYLRQLRRAGRSDERRELHARFICSSRPAELIEGLEEARHRQELRLYLGRISRQRDSLEGRSGKAISARLVRLLSELDDVWTRADVVITLGDVDLPLARAEVRQRFTTDPDSRIRAAAAEALGRRPDETGEHLLVEWVAAHPELGDSEVTWVRHAVVESLSRFPSPAALAALDSELANAEDAGRLYGVLHALSARGDAGAATAMRSRFEELVDENPPDCVALGQTLRFRFEARYQAANGGAFDPSATEDARSAFARCPGDESTAFGEILGLWARHRDSAQLPLLRELRADHPNRAIRGRADAALRALTSQGHD